MIGGPNKRARWAWASLSRATAILSPCALLLACWLSHTLGTNLTRYISNTGAWLCYHP
ncbi:hypothetical protein RSAG8_05106, partial [Rhizoctonia solani AG-8 WAC10335]